MNRLYELRTLIDRADQCYYNNVGRPADDSVYDGWKRELKELDPDDIRHTRVGAPVSADSALLKVRHGAVMGSLNNALNEEEFRTWHEKMADRWQPNGKDDDIRYNVSWKMDGCTGVLRYHDGVLVQAATRGDGQVGEDITGNAVRMEGVPAEVWYKDDVQLRHQKTSMMRNIMPVTTAFTGEVRGEIMLFNEDWLALDPDQTSNPRNLGNGVARRKAGEDTERLRFIAFRAYNEAGVPFDGMWDGEGPQTESGMQLWLSTHGFQTVQSRRNLTFLQVLNLYRFVQGFPMEPGIKMDMPAIQQRDKLPFEVDGLVVKVESLVFQEKLGESDNRPRAQIAFKFPPRGADSVVQSVELSVGHTGNIIPTANLKPVKIGGVTVSRALLCNWDEIKRLDVGIGDLVRVTRQGDVIPKIIEVRSRAADRKPIPQPVECPVCHGPIDRRTGIDGSVGVMVYCVSSACPAKQVGKIKTWIKKLDIQGLGDVFIDNLFSSRPLDNPSDPFILGTVADIYRLHEPQKIAVLAQVLGLARAKKVLAEIEKKKNLTLAEFLGSMGIEGLGRRRVAIVQGKCPGQFDQLSDWTSGKLAAMAEAAGLPGSAVRIYEQIRANITLIQQLLDTGVTIKTAAPVPPKKAGSMVFCITGKLSQPKEHFHNLMTEKGHSFVETYKKGIDYLVAADPSSGSSKLAKAAKDGVKVISEDALLELLK